MFESKKKHVQIDDLATSYLSRSLEQTHEIGRRLGRQLKGGEMVLLNGELGAGKTALVRGVAESLGAGSWRGSPSYTLVNEYLSTPKLIHVDLYRLSTAEVEELGLEEYVRGDSVMVVEWAKRAEGYLVALGPRQVIRINIEPVGPEQRAVEVETQG